MPSGAGPRVEPSWWAGDAWQDVAPPPPHELLLRSGGGERAAVPPPPNPCSEAFAQDVAGG